MSYPKQTAQLRPTRGFISDTPAHEVGPDFYTLMTNVITRGGFAQRIMGRQRKIMRHPNTRTLRQHLQLHSNRI